MKNVVKIGILTLLQFGNVAQAQEQPGELDVKSATVNPREMFNCPFNHVFEQASKSNPNFKQALLEHEKQIAIKSSKYNNSANQIHGRSFKAAAQYETIPVIFHVVLNSGQIAQMGGQDSIIDRIKSQLDVLNEDFNALNADSTQIPAPFKPLYANMNVKFGFAHTDPNGNYTPGYEFINTSKSEFNVDPGSGTFGSKGYCSDAKYSSVGGADAWDAQKYLNIWVINITPFGVAGVGSPPPYPLYGGTADFPWTEQGVVLSYVTLGKRKSSGQYFPFPPAIQGRTLVHEVGHFFNLFHTFGMFSFVNANCSDDDGVNDTPSQHTYSQMNPTFPVTDSCSPSYPGIMFMNHMDYTDDKYRVMFTHGQKNRAWVEIDSGGFRHELFQHPELLSNGFSLGIKENNRAITYSGYPNPATSECTMSYQADNIPSVIVVLNQMGQIMIQMSNNNLSEVKIDLRSLEKGLYFVRSQFKNITLTSKLLVN